jgi:glycine betaine/choline ABC-type transport system substrate-binding protein
MNRQALERQPLLAPTLEALAGRIDAAAMRSLNHAVDGEHRAPAEVAREFLAALARQPPR